MFDSKMRDENMRTMRKTEGKSYFVCGTVVAVREEKLFDCPYLLQDHSEPGQDSEERELTGAGKALCLALGLLEELLIYVLFGIYLATAPVLVTGFLWVALSIVTGGLLLAASQVVEMLLRLRYRAANLYSSFHLQ